MGRRVNKKYLLLRASERVKAQIYELQTRKIKNYKQNIKGARDEIFRRDPGYECHIPPHHPKKLPRLAQPVTGGHIPRICPYAPGTTTGEEIIRICPSTSRRARILCAVGIYPWNVHMPPPRHQRTHKKITKGEGDAATQSRDRQRVQETKRQKTNTKMKSYNY